MLDDEQLRRLLKACEGREFADRRDAAILRLLLDTGMRRAEIAGLRVAEVDFDHDVAVVLGKGRRPRACPFGRKTAQALDRYLRVRAAHRDAALLLWLARPVLFSAAFGGAWLWPLLGIVFLPLTTLFYVVLWSPGGLVGWDWFWLFLAFLLDLGGAASSGYANRGRVPGYGGAPAVAV